ncbi:MAG: hypothetical protein ACIAS6_06815, partial [Phycisphaerales bacterium JB060]
MARTKGSAGSATAEKSSKSGAKTDEKSNGAVEVVAPEKDKGDAKAPTTTAPQKAEPSPEKAKALNLAVGQIERNFGKGAIMRLDENAALNIPGISTGALSLDLALGGRGIPRGRI